MRVAFLSSLIGLICLCPVAASELQLELAVGEARLQAEYARSPNERARGLMERTELPGNQGMLFRFDDFRRHCLWMKDTPLPLSAAFMDEQGRIVDVIDLEPLSTAIRCSREPARYALEVNQGWFRQHRQGVGDQVKVIPVVD
ncbi:MAG TPA: DUF192 domain-containing protein [Pseudomonas sp.]|nr:DUF192 domain-containing protein [Pseudomonas sp.]